MSDEAQVLLSASLVLPPGWCLAQDANGAPLYVGPFAAKPPGLGEARLYLAPDVYRAVRPMVDAIAREHGLAMGKDED